MHLSCPSRPGEEWLCLDPHVVLLVVLRNEEVSIPPRSLRPSLDRDRRFPRGSKHELDVAFFSFSLGVSFPG